MRQKIKYTDKKGKLEGILHQEEKKLYLKFNGSEFYSHFLGDYTPLNKELIDRRFELDKNDYLTNFSLIFKLSLKFIIDKECRYIDLNCNLTVKNDEIGYSNPFLQCKLQINDIKIDMSTAGTIEGAINQINHELPSNIKCQVCYNCKFSDYSIYGQQFWGDMMCYKNIKAEYAKVSGKDDFMELMANFDSIVPESHTCPEFEVRPKNIGYRG